MFETDFTEEFGFAGSVESGNDREVAESHTQIKEHKRSKVFKDERERIIDDYHAALLASAREADRPKNFDERITEPSCVRKSVVYYYRWIPTGYAYSLSPAR